MRRGLVDRYVLSIHPLVLGTGRRLFDDAVPYARLELVEATTSPAGVVTATYRAPAVSRAPLAAPGKPAM
jgi:dihydrofolate reductase